MKNARSPLSFFIVFVSSIVINVASGKSTFDTLQHTLPAYAVAANAKTILVSPSACSRELDVFREAVDMRKLWALRVLDSSGEPKSGFMYGNNYWLGSRAQCIDTENTNPLSIDPDAVKNASKFRKTEDEFPPYKINYFAAYFRHNSTLQYHVKLVTEDLVTLGLCLPASCTTDQLSAILKTIFQNRTLMIGDLYAVDFKLEDVKNLQNDHEWLKNGTVITVLVVLVITLSLMTAGTAYDILVYEKYRKNSPGVTTNISEGFVTEKIKRPGMFAEIITCFSIYTNTKMIFKTESEPGDVAPIHGLRFFGMAMIIIVHTIYYMLNTLDNIVIITRMNDELILQPVRNGVIMVDTFFVLGGFLVAYLYFTSKLRRSKEDKPVTFKSEAVEFFRKIVKRFIRLTPAYIMLIGLVKINSTWHSKISVFNLDVKPEEMCAKYWWRNLLYVNNLFSAEESCMLWSWYLADDMQFFILGTFIVMLSSIYFYTAATLLGFIFVSSTVLSGCIAYFYRYTLTMDQVIATLRLLYASPWARIGPYIVGLVAGYIFTKLNNKLTLPRSYIVALWLFTMFGNLFILFGLWWKEWISVLSSAFFTAFCHTVWGIGIAWIIIACCTNNGGFCNTVLTLKIWVPLSRLTYCAYLLNPVIISSIYMHSETAMHVDYLTSVSMCFGMIVLSFLCSYAYSLMMEIPYVRMIKMLTTRRKQLRY